MDCELSTYNYCMFLGSPSQSLAFYHRNIDYQHNSFSYLYNLKEKVKSGLCN